MYLKIAYIWVLNVIQMKNTSLIWSLLAETIVPSLTVYLTHKFERMTNFDYFILLIGIIAIGCTITYYLLSKKIKYLTEVLKSHKSKLIKHNRTFEHLMTLTGTTDAMNQIIITTRKNKGILGLEETDEELLNERKGKKKIDDNK